MKFKIYRLFFFPLWLSVGCVVADESDWVDIPAANEVSLNLGFYSENELSGGINAVFQFYRFSDLHFQFSHYDGDNEQNTFASDSNSTYVLGWVSDRLLTHGGGVFIEYTKQDSGLTSSDFSAFYQYQSNRVSLKARTLFGQVKIDAPQFSSSSNRFSRERAGRNVFTRSENIQRVGLGLEILYAQQLWQFLAHVNIYDYRDESSIESETSFSIDDAFSEDVNSDLSLILRRFYSQTLQGFIEQGFSREQAQSLTNNLFLENESAIIERAQQVGNLSQRQGLNDINQQVVNGYKSLLSRYDFGLEWQFELNQTGFYVGSQFYESYIDEVFSSVLFFGC